MDTPNTPQAMAGIMALKKWTKEIGVESTTVWRWRKAGWIKTVNICGRPYVTAEAMAEFKRRAEAGEFAAEHVAPTKSKTT